MQVRVLLRSLLDLYQLQILKGAVSLCQQKNKDMATQKIPHGAFSEMMSAIRYFDKVDEGCGYDRLNAKMRIIQMAYSLDDNELAIVEKWAYDKYYKG